MAPSEPNSPGRWPTVLHGRSADPRIPEWIAAIDREQLSLFDRRNLDEAQRDYDKATKIPANLAEETAKAASEGQQIWAAARAEKDFSRFTPALKRDIELKRETARCLAEPGTDLYDALLDEFEPGARAAELLPLLEGLRPRLVALRGKIAEKQEPKALKGHFPAAAQLDLARRIATRIGYDMKADRLDTVVQSLLPRHRRRRTHHHARRRSRPVQLPLLDRSRSRARALRPGRARLLHAGR